MNANTEIKTVDEVEIVEIAPPLAMTPSVMLGQAIKSGASVELVERLMALMERDDANNARKAFDFAMAAAKAEMPTIVKSQEVDYSTAKGRTNYKYEDLATISKAVDPVLSKFGLSYRFRASQNGALLSVVCIICHRDGYSEETELSAANDSSGGKNSIQAVGSAATYLQRYTLKLALGLSVARDDDAQSCAPQAPATVSPEQYISLRDKAIEAGVPEEIICKAGRVSDLQQFPAADFGSAMKKLAITIEQNKPAPSADIGDDEIPY